jgi:hypothetical protein
MQFVLYGLMLHSFSAHALSIQFYMFTDFCPSYVWMGLVWLHEPKDFLFLSPCESWSSLVLWLNCFHIPLFTWCSTWQQRKVTPILQTSLTMFFYCRCNSTIASQAQSQKLPFILFLQVLYFTANTTVCVMRCITERWLNLICFYTKFETQTNIVMCMGDDTGGLDWYLELVYTFRS